MTVQCNVPNWSTNVPFLLVIREENFWSGMPRQTLRWSIIRTSDVNSSRVDTLSGESWTCFDSTSSEHIPIFRSRVIRILEAASSCSILQSRTELVVEYIKVHRSKVVRDTCSVQCLRFAAGFLQLEKQLVRANLCLNPRHVSFFHISSFPSFLVLLSETCDDSSP